MPQDVLPHNNVLLRNPQLQRLPGHSHLRQQKPHSLEACQQQNYPQDLVVHAVSNGSLIRSVRYADFFRDRSGRWWGVALAQRGVGSAPMGREGVWVGVAGSVRWIHCSRSVLTWSFSRESLVKRRAWRCFWRRQGMLIWYRAGRRRASISQAEEYHLEPECDCAGGCYSSVA